MTIDTSKIPGYSAMSADEKLAALEAYEIEVPTADDSAEVKKLKGIISTRNSEVAEFKRKWESTLSEQQIAEQKRAEEAQAMADELSTLRKEKTISGYEANFLTAGYSPELAKASATAMADGDTATVFQNLNAFITERTHSIQAEALNLQPSLSKGAPPATVDALADMSDAEYYKYMHGAK